VPEGGDSVLDETQLLPSPNAESIESNPVTPDRLDRMLAIVATLGDIELDKLIRIAEILAEK
jgi:hypothetical protein